MAEEMMMAVRESESHHAKMDTSTEAAAADPYNRMVVLAETDQRPGWHQGGCFSVIGLKAMDDIAVVSDLAPGCREAGGWVELPQDFRLTRHALRMGLSESTENATVACYALVGQSVQDAQLLLQLQELNRKSSVTV